MMCPAEIEPAGCGEYKNWLPNPKFKDRSLELAFEVAGTKEIKPMDRNILNDWNVLNDWNRGGADVA